VAKATRPGRRTELAPISEIKKVAEPIEIADAGGVNINPAKEDTLKAQADFSYGQTTIGTTEVQLPAAACVKGVLVKALSTNTGIVYIGKTGVLATTGYELTAGEAVTIEVDNVNKLFAIADTADQKVSWIGV
jgi:hypothetical protein